MEEITHDDPVGVVKEMLNARYCTTDELHEVARTLTLTKVFWCCKKAGGSGSWLIVVTDNNVN